MKNTIKFENLNWVNILEPTEEDLRYLKEEFKLHPLTLKSIMMPGHYPDIEIFKNYIFIILHYLSSKNGEVQIKEFDIVAGQNFLITICHQPIKPINLLFEECQKSEAVKKEFLGRGIDHLLFMIMSSILKKKLLQIDEIENKIESIEKKMFIGKEKEMVKEISFVKREIIDFWRTIEPQRIIFQSLENSGEFFWGEEFKHNLSVLFRMHKKIDNTLKTLKESIESLEETNQINVSIKINEIMRVLALFSAIFLPLSLLANLWSVNVNFLPFGGHPYAFWIIIGIMIVTLSTTILYFKAKKWL